MELKSHIVNDISIVELSGRFDSYEAPRLTTWFEKATPKVVVNLSDVSFVDSSALALLVKGLKHCRQQGGDLALCSLQQPVRVIFELTRLDKAFGIYANEDEAIQALHGKSA
jgi:anti-sigma B factor antagonist